MSAPPGALFFVPKPAKGAAYQWLTMELLSALRTLLAYRTERNRRFGSRGDLEMHQSVLLQQHLAWLRRHSPYFREKLEASGRKTGPWEQLQDLPVVDKAAWLASFDQSNTRGLKLAQVQEAALKAERDRDFVPTVEGCTVGLSSGTSGSRGVFVVSPEERAKWAGVILAKLLPRGLFAKERVAFFLRANSNLYTSVDSRWLKFKFFDLLGSFPTHLVALSGFQPTIIVAPAQVLRAIALSRPIGAYKQAIAISVAEVLDDSTRQLLWERFADVKEVYQATEGLLATTCEHGSLHLNEEHVIFEREWLDRDRFVPIITDLSRRTQPLVRYRLNDVLRVHRNPCLCGRHTAVIGAIEGRSDDQLVLPGQDGQPVTVFADAISRAIARVLPLEAEYQLTQDGPNDLVFECSAGAYPALKVNQALNQLFEAYGVAAGSIRWQLEPEMRAATDLASKRRRIRNVHGH